MRDLFSQKTFLVLITTSFFVVVFSTYYIFLFKKDYFFQIQADCDTSQEICYTEVCEDGSEDCENTYYKLFRLEASDFEKCYLQDDCVKMCTDKEIVCENIECDSEDPEATCSVITMPDEQSTGEIPMDE